MTVAGTLDSNCTGSSPSPAPSSETLAPAPASADGMYVFSNCLVPFWFEE